MRVHAIYNDGHMAQSYAVVVDVEGDDLVARDADGTELDRWPLTEVRLVGKPGMGLAVRLRRGDRGDARLTLENADELKAVAAVCPHLRRGNRADRRMGLRVLFWGTAAAVSAVLLFLVLIPNIAGSIAAAIPEQWERRLGDDAYPKVMDLFARLEGKKSDGLVCEGADGQVALAALVDRLQGGLDQPVSAEVVVLDLDMVNAFALPGGRILLMRGLVDQAEGPEEVAGVLAHELGHVTGRHALVRLVEEAGTSALIGLLLGDITGGTVLAAMGRILLGASYTREAEREADQIGLEVLHRTGIGADGLKRFFERLKKQYGDMTGVLTLLSTHPATTDRIREITEHPPPDAPRPALDEGAWQALQSICD